MQVESDPDSAWVAELSHRSPEDAEAAIAEARAERGLYRYLATQHSREGRESYVEIDAPLELHAIVRLARPRHVVEVGVSSGVSSAYLLNAMGKNQDGMLHSVDRPSHERTAPNGGKRTQWSWSLPPGKSSGWAVPPRLWRRWDLRLGDKADVLPILAEQLPRIDLLVYDVPHECSATRKELRGLSPLFGPGAVAIVDHGPGGGLCPALASCARDWGSVARRRAGLGLFGARRPSK